MLLDGVDDDEARASLSQTQEDCRLDSGTLVPSLLQFTSVYLLDWYRSTNADTPAARAAQGSGRLEFVACNLSVRMLTYADVC